jgi:hypothetical protein
MIVDKRTSSLANIHDVVWTVISSDPMNSEAAVTAFGASLRAG